MAGTLRFLQRILTEFGIRLYGTRSTSRLLVIIDSRAYVYFSSDSAAARRRAGRALPTMVSKTRGQEYAAVPPLSHHIESQVAITHHRAGAWTQVSHPPQTRTSMITF